MPTEFLSPGKRKRNSAHNARACTSHPTPTKYSQNVTTLRFDAFHKSYKIHGDVPVLTPAIRTSQTARSARGPRCLLDRVDSSALSSRVIFPSARSPNITPITTVVAHEPPDQRKSESM